MRDVCIVGGGVSGLAASIFTARAGLDTLVIDGGESILARNASLENYPGFPDGVDARRYLHLVREQARNAGATFELGRVTRAEPVDETDLEDGFVLETDGGEPLEARRVIAASWSDSEYLVPLDVGRLKRGSKHFVDVDQGGRTAVDGVYAAGRLAKEPHQAIVAAGHGRKSASRSSTIRTPTSITTGSLLRATLRTATVRFRRVVKRSTTKSDGQETNRPEKRCSRRSRSRLTTDRRCTRASRTTREAPGRR